MLADIRGTRIFFDVEGMSVRPGAMGVTERPTAFFVHGGPGLDHVAMKGCAKELAERMQLVFFDHRGHGRSAPIPPESFSLDECVEDMEALRRYLGLGPIISVGVSFGGMVAMAHASRYPDSVSHLVLGATAPHKGLLVRASEIVAERGTPEQQDMLQRLIAGTLDGREDMIEYFRILGPLYGNSFDENAFFKRISRSILTPEIAFRAYRPGGHAQTFDLRPELKNITAPTLILAGRHDFICAPEFSEEMHQLIPGSTLRIFENSSHFISGDEPESYVDAILGFLVYNENSKS